MRANAATASSVRIGNLFASRSADEYLSCVAHDYVGVHHGTGLTYDRVALLKRLQAVFKSEDLAA